MSAIEDIDYQGYYEWIENRIKDWEYARGLNVFELAKILNNNIEKIDTTYKKMTIDIISKVFSGKIITEKQRNAINNAYAFLDLDDLE